MVGVGPPSDWVSGADRAGGDEAPARCWEEDLSAAAAADDAVKKRWVSVYLLVMPSYFTSCV